MINSICSSEMSRLTFSLLSFITSRMLHRISSDSISLFPLVSSCQPDSSSLRGKILLIDFLTHYRNMFLCIMWYEGYDPFYDGMFHFKITRHQVSHLVIYSSGSKIHTTKMIESLRVCIRLTYYYILANYVKQGLDISYIFIWKRL